MNLLVIHRVKIFLKKYASRRFDQDDVLILLLDLRDVAKPESLVRELGHFLAHPHGRDKGIVFSRLNAVRREIIEKFDDVISGNGLPVMKSLCTEIDLIESLCHAIRDLGLSPGPLLSPANDIRAKDLVLCIIGLLSSSTIIVNGEKQPLVLSLGRGGEFLLVTVTITVKHQGKHLALSWPILSTSCRVDKSSQSLVAPWASPQPFIARRQADGKLAFLRLETDLEQF